MDPKSPLVMITAGTSRLGRAMLTTFAANGYRVSFSCAPGDPDANGLQSLLKSEFKTEAECLQMHAADEAAIAKADALLSSVDILINCYDPAPHARFLAADPSETDSFVDRRFQDLLLFTRAVVLHMLKRNHGDILNIGMANDPGHPDSSISKILSAGIDGLTEAIRMDLFGSKVRVGIITPDPKGISEADIAGAALWTIQRPRPTGVTEIVMTSFAVGPQ